MHRLAAARWLAESGDPEQAALLLRWLDGPQLLHEGEGLRHHAVGADLPTPRYRPQVEEAREALRFVPQ